MIWMLLAGLAYAEGPGLPPSGTMADCAAWGAGRGNPLEDTHSDLGFRKGSAELRPGFEMWRHLGESAEGYFWSLCVIVHPERKGHFEDVTLAGERAAVIGSIFAAQDVPAERVHILLSDEVRPGGEAVDHVAFVLPVEEIQRLEAARSGEPVSPPPEPVAAPPAAPAVAVDPAFCPAVAKLFQGAADEFSAYRGELKDQGLRQTWTLAPLPAGALSGRVYVDRGQKGDASLVLAERKGGVAAVRSVYDAYVAALDACPLGATFVSDDQTLEGLQYHVYIPFGVEGPLGQRVMTVQISESPNFDVESGAFAEGRVVLSIRRP